MRLYIHTHRASVVGCGRNAPKSLPSRRASSSVLNVSASCLKSIKYPSALVGP